MSDLRKAAQQAVNEWRTDPGSVRMASLMMALERALSKPTPLTSEEMSQWVKTTWKQCQDKAWEESHE